MHLKTTNYLLLFSLFSVFAYASDQYNVRLNAAGYQVTKAGPNLSGTDGCKINDFGQQIEHDLSKDPITSKISLKYNAISAEIDSSSYDFYLTNRQGKKIYTAKQYTEGLLLAPYRFIEVTGRNTESNSSISINGHHYQVTDIWFSSVCLTQKDCQEYVNTSIGFVNATSNDKAICYVYTTPYVPNENKTAHVSHRLNKEKLTKQLGLANEKCKNVSINGNCAK